MLAYCVGRPLVSTATPPLLMCRRSIALTGFVNSPGRIQVGIAESFSLFFFNQISCPSERIMSATEFDSDYLTLESVQYIFTVCVRLRLPHEIRYLAILIFTRFSLQFRFLFPAVNLPSCRRLREWEKVEANLSRFVNRLQIQSLSSKQVCSCLRSLGVAYTQRAALKSELRILKTLNFRLPQTPLVYSEALFKSVGLFSSWPPVDLKSVWEHTLLFLDIVFLHHEQVSREYYCFSSS
ncbi:unnamed protein product [Heligmosomoides polygyrus]|uniref:Cyclin N-terminal domain-containing protein n=1 Tax=Heligmosomoides polygyrus TaxID=6339 RepID=A0A3P8H0M5_HELPZ|nr:unnamed protein product [Heligmosomoides polygyrus]